METKEKILIEQGEEISARDGAVCSIKSHG